MLERRLPEILWLPLIIYLVWWVALFVVLSSRLELISPLIEYRKMVYLAGGAIWHVFVLVVAMNKSARVNLQAFLSRIAGRHSFSSLPGVLFGLAVIDLGLYYVLTT